MINKTIPVEVRQIFYNYKDGFVIDTIRKIAFTYYSVKESFPSEKVVNKSSWTIMLSDGTSIDLNSLNSTYFTSKEELLKHIVNLVV